MRPGLVEMHVQAAAEHQGVSDAEVAIERRVLCDEADPRQDAVRLARVAAEDGDLAGARRQHPDRELQERRLAGAVWADETDDPPGRQRERTVAQSPLVAVALTEFAGLENVEADHATLASACSRRVLLTSARMLSSSSPASFASRSQGSSLRRMRGKVSGGRPPSVPTTNVP